MGQQEAADAGVRVLLVTGAGEKAFVAGADIAAMSGMSPLEGRAFALAAMGLMRGLEAAPFPVIALVLSTIYEGYRWTPHGLAGVALILAGNVVVLMWKRGRAGV